MVSGFSVRLESAEVLAALGAMDTAFGPVAMELFMRGTARPMLQQKMKSRFGGAGDGSVGGRWRPLSEASQRIRQAGIDAGYYPGITPSSPINIRTNEMYSFLTSADGDFFSTSFMSTFMYPGRITNERVYNKIHTAQLGKDSTPRRPVLGIESSESIMIIEALGGFVRGRATGRARA